MNKDAFLARCKQLKTKTVDLGDGESITVRELTGKERDHIEGLFNQGTKAGNYAGIRTQIALYSVMDDDGNQMFESADRAKVDAVPGSILDAVMLATLELSGLDKLSKDELEKNSASTQAGSSGSV